MASLFLLMDEKNDADVEMTDSWLLEEDEYMYDEFFPLTDLPMEIQDMIMEECISVTRDNKERLSRLACVSHRWQERVKTILWAKLGNFKQNPFIYRRSSFRATHLDDFPKYVIGKRCKILHTIEIDLDLDEEGQMELLAWPPASPNHVRSMRIVRQKLRFQKYMDALFAALNAFANPDDNSQGHISLRVRVHGAKRDMKTGERLPVRPDEIEPAFELHTGGPELFANTKENTVVRHFELILNPDGGAYNKRKTDTHYFSGHTVTQFLLRCTNACSYTHFVDMVPRNQRMLQRNFNEEEARERMKAAHVGLSAWRTTAFPPSFNELTLRHSRQDTSTSTSSTNTSHYLTKPVSIEGIAHIASQISVVTIDNIISPLKFLESVASSQPQALLWPKMRHLTLRGQVPRVYTQTSPTLQIDSEQGEKLLMQLGELVQRMPVVERVEMEVVVGDVEVWERVKASLLFEYVPKDRDEHFQLTIKSDYKRLVLHSGSYVAWVRAAERTRGVPVRMEVNCNCPAGYEMCRQGDNQSSSSSDSDDSDGI